MTFFSKLTFFQKHIFQEHYIRVSNSLDLDEDGHSVGPDLGLKCLQGYQQTTKVAASKYGCHVLRNLVNVYMSSCNRNDSVYT